MILTLLPGPGMAQEELSGYTLKAAVELVLVNVVVRDKSGALVKGLKAEDFSVLEDGKQQNISSFDFQQVEAFAAAPAENNPGQMLSQPSRAAAKPAITANSPAALTQQLRDRRLVVLFFDVSSMQPEDVERAVKAAMNYVDHQMQSADLVAVVSLDSQLTTLQDFTSDHEQLKKAIQTLNPTGGQGFDTGSTGSTEGTADNSQAFTADDTEYNIFNTDRRLAAIRSLATDLGKVQEKKSVIYFSSGMSKTGIENQSQLRAAINEAVRGNLSLYTIDMRGLEAMIPGGEAQDASMRGTSPYSGAGVRSQYSANFDSQETITTLANDTGGRAFTDTNDFSTVFNRMQADTSAYYLIGYHSSNRARDGRYRKITVKTRLQNVRLEYRAGYYAPRDFAHARGEDREQLLVDELNSELPSTDLDMYLSAAYFRMSADRFFVPVALVVRGSQIPFRASGDKDKAALDVIGVIRDQDQRPVGNVRDTVKLNLDTSQGARRKNVQYQTSFYLAPGKYHLKFVVRENTNGLMGSFETDLVIPDFKRSPLKMSAVVLGTQVIPQAKKRSEDPLVHDGSELVPNVTHIVAPDGHLYFYYEVYDPAKNQEAGPGRPNASAGEKAAIRLLTNITFFRGRTKAYETQLVQASQLTAPDRKAAAFQFDVPVSRLPAGFYTCQVNVIDDAAGTFTFPRLTMLVRAPAKAGNPATSQ